MKVLWMAGLLILVKSTPVLANELLEITTINSDTVTEPLLAKPGTYLGEKFVFSQTHTGNVLVRVGVWESGAGKTVIEDFPFTEYVLMISGIVVVTNESGVSNKYSAGDTFVIPKGWTGTWDVRERMKKQIVRIGSEKLPTANSASD